MPRVVKESQLNEIDHREFGPIYITYPDVPNSGNLEIKTDQRLAPVVATNKEAKLMEDRSLTVQVSGSVDDDHAVVARVKRSLGLELTEPD